MTVKHAVVRTALLAVALAAPATALAQQPAKAGPPACGLRAIPMAVGNYWVYKLAAGTDQVTTRALRVDPRASERFPEDVLELQGYLSDESLVPTINAIQLRP